jgi:hypothetical protein
MEYAATIFVVIAGVAAILAVIISGLQPENDWFTNDHKVKVFREVDND